MTLNTYMNPYLAGFLLGVLLLTTFAIAGRGLGASGAMSQVLVHAYEVVNVENEYVVAQKESSHLLNSWIIVEVVGIFLGAFLSAKQSHRFSRELVKGSGISNRRRIINALIGGVLMGFAARLARGCTSGQALTGGALLSLGSWAFMLAVFIGSYVAIVIVKRDWQ